MTPHPHSTTTGGLAQFAELFSKIAPQQLEQVTILTPNKRLARFLRDQHTQFASQGAGKRGTQAWRSLNCWSFQGWLQQLWAQVQTTSAHAASGRMLMSPTQELIIWQGVIDGHPETPPLLNGQATAMLAMQAWRLCHDWGVPFHQLSEQEQGTLDAPLFQRWTKTFQEACQQRQLMTIAELPHIILEAFQSADGALSRPEKLVLYGFDEHTHQQQQIFRTLQQDGVDLIDWALKPTANPTRQQQACSDLHHEIQTAAHWAQQCHQASPNARIAIVVPQLAQRRQAIERIFQAVFEPQYIDPMQPQHAPGFNLSAGQPLDQLPLITAALTALQCAPLHQGRPNVAAINIEKASQFLRSPFIGSEDEMGARASLDCALREQSDTVSFMQLKALAGRQIHLGESQSVAVSSVAESADITRRCPDLYDRLEQVQQFIRSQLKFKHYPSRWAERFSELLILVGWPGQRPLDTLEYQQLQTWQLALDEFAKLDAITPPIDANKARQYLQLTVARTSFQPQTKDSPIQILGVLEAAGLPFDHLWLMNLDDESWPPAPNPNPLLPRALQIQYNLPQSSPDRELLYAQRLTERLMQSTCNMVFSYAKHQGDKEVGPSPLLSDLAIQELIATDSHQTTRAHQLYASQSMEASPDYCGSKITEPESVRGGAQLLQDQAACPFRAFAKYRLRTHEIPATVPGLDAAERGNLLHHAMEIIWRKLKTQQKLLQQTPEALDQLVQQAIDSACQRIKIKPFVGPRFLQLEQARLGAQIHTWLALEQQRPPFKVLFNEGRKTIKIGKLPLHIRYDRIDQLEDGSWFVLDYKTGKPDIKSWAGERPDDPQVPLYAVANQRKVSGAGFGQINVDDITFKGLGEQPVADGIKHPEDVSDKLNLPDRWPELLEHWRTVLERLAQDYLVGSAAVAPKNPPLTCRYCDLKALCRIKEQFNLDEEELTPS